jgi:hypothetical protein
MGSGGIKPGELGRGTKAGPDVLMVKGCRKVVGGAGFCG